MLFRSDPIEEDSQTPPQTQSKRAPKAAPKKKKPVASRKASTTGAEKSKAESTSGSKQPTKSQKKKNTGNSAASSSAWGATGKGKGQKKSTVWDEYDDAVEDGLDMELEKLEKHCWSVSIQPRFSIF